MLQRAASNAYSWWMASHIRTKQSKWMEQNLADMEEKVSAVIKLLSEEGDSFMQKANMYYKKRPELIHFVEEFFRGYRALADRYDHLSTELQNANNTIAQVCPDQVRGMEDDEDDPPPRFRKKPTDNMGKVPNVPKLPVKELKFITSTKKKVQEKKESKATAARATAASKSGLTKDEGIGEIGRIQKRILALQTEKEFVKSSYESGLAKYRDVENEIKAMQEKVDTLQDEFGEGRVIDDEEARNLMAATALKSCKDTLNQLQETQDKAVTEAEVEQTRIKVSRGKLDSLKKKFLPNESFADEPRIGSTKPKPKVSHVVEKIKDDTESEVGDDESVTDMAEKIDVLVNKVTSLETEVASQTALIQRLRLENDEIQAQIQSHEDGKADLTDDEKHDLKLKITEMELKLQGIQDLNHGLEDQNKNMQSHFNEAQSNLDQLSQKVKPVEELESTKTLSVSPKAPKKVRKKAGKEFLAPKVTSSPPDQVESEKGSNEQVPADVTNESKELNSLLEPANEGGETEDSQKISAAETGSSHKISAGETRDSHEIYAGQTGGSHEIYAGQTGGSHEAPSNLDQLSQNVKPVEELESTKILSVSPKKEPKKAPKKVLKKAGKEFLAPKVTSSPPDQVESEKGSHEQVPTDVTNESKELNSLPEPANEGGEIEDSQKISAAKKGSSHKISAGETRDSHEIYAGQTGGSHEAQSNLDQLSQKVKPVEELESTKTLSVSPKKAPKKVLKKAGKEFLAPKVTSSPPDQVESEKGSQEQVPTNATNESEELNSLPEPANERSETGNSQKISADETGGSHEICAGETGGSYEICAGETVGSHEISADETGSSHENSKVETVGSHEISAGETGGIHESSAVEVGGSHEISEVSDRGEDPKGMANVVGQASSVIANTVTESVSKDHEYLELSQNLEKTKKKLMEVEANHLNELFEITLQLKELKNSNSKKDEEIRSLRLKLSKIMIDSNRNDNNNEETDEYKESSEESPAPKQKLGQLLAQEGGEDEEETITMPVKDPESASPVEEKFRSNIDELLEENLDFWFRFSSTLYKIQRFKTGVKDLEEEVLKLDERQNEEGSNSSKYSIKSDVRPLYKHLKEMQTDLSAWIEKSASLKEELKNRSASLTELQEEITKALKASAEDEEFKFTSFQAAKFQGEILNMKQENNRVADELQAGLDLAMTLHRDAENSITKLSNDWGLSGSKSRHGSNSRSSSRSQTGAHSNVPLRSFIFGAKQKKKNSIFSSVVQQRKNKSGY